jgi:formamidopyrimidine-DNA glycosylase
MPELPDVELFKRYLESHALRQPIRAAQVNDARILGALPPARFVATLTGNRLEAARRHGKHLLVRLAREGWLTLHFGMTGGLAWFEDLADDPPYDRVRLDFASGGHLAYVNRRMLGRVGLTADAEAFIAAEELGPDALDPAFDAAAFEAALAGRRRDLKSVLMDQALLAGIGNIYADEILFQARLHPQTPAPTLSAAQQAELFAQLKRVLETATRRGAGAEQSIERLPDDCLLPQRRKDGRCPRCSHEIATLKSAGRTSYYCPHCQPAPVR